MYNIDNIKSYIIICSSLMNKWWCFCWYWWKIGGNGAQLYRLDAVVNIPTERPLRPSWTVRSYKRLEGIIYNDPKKQKLVFFRIIVDDSFEPLVRTVHEGLSDRSVGIFTLVSISLRTIPFNSPRRMLYSFFQPYSFRLLNWPFYSHKCALRISTLLFPFSCLERDVTSWRALDVQLS